MKRLLVLLCAAALISGIAEIAIAIPVEFSETFLDGKTDDNYFDVWEGWWARFTFKLDVNGGRAKLFDAGGTQQSSQLPTEDETGYDEALYDPVSEAYLNFTFSSEDWTPEEVKIKTKFLGEDDVLIMEKTYWLGAGWPFFWRQYTDLSIDLGEEGLLDDLGGSGSRLRSVVMAPDWGFWLINNDFRIDQGNLTAYAEPIPEPGTLLLLGTGLIGLAGYRFRRRKKK